MVAFGLVVALLVVVVLAAYLGLHSVERMERSLAEIIDLRRSTNGQRAALLSAMLTADPAGREAFLAETGEYAAQSRSALASLQNDHADDPGLSDQLTQIAALTSEFERTREQEIIPLLRASKIEEATALTLGVQEKRRIGIRSLELEFSAVVRSRIDARLTWTRAILAVAGGLAVLTAAAMVIVLTRLIAHPLAEITSVAERIARGDLNTPLRADQRSDEVGLLRLAFRRMNDSLTELVGRVRQIAAGDLTARIQPQSEHDVLGAAFASMTDNLRKLIGELVNAAGVLASSTTEISAATTQIAANASETAAAVSETTATVAEVKQASGNSSEMAEHVSSQAQKVADVSQRGRISVEQVVTGMTQIREHMDSIAASILGLNAQGQRIGEIITTVDDVASQSKMLAINASMEAAKAGEEGKGFAVVAQEVKNLAEQSRQATNRVRAILTEIEKATNSAVLTTEQGSKAVDEGVRQSSAAGNSIAALSDSIAESAHASAQIATASHQQSIGMDQVSLAMDSIQTACARMATAARQAEVEAQRLVGLGRKLGQLVANFKV